MPRASMMLRLRETKTQLQVTRRVSRGDRVQSSVSGFAGADNVFTGQSDSPRVGVYVSSVPCKRCTRTERRFSNNRVRAICVCVCVNFARAKHTPHESCAGSQY